MAFHIETIQVKVPIDGILLLLFILVLIFNNKKKKYISNEYNRFHPYGTSSNDSHDISKTASKTLQKSITGWYHIDINVCLQYYIIMYLPMF